MDCIFCKIINKELPAAVLHEDDDFIVILDRFPQAAGHTLIIPKTHSRDLFDLGEKPAQRILSLAAEVAAKLKDITGYQGINLIQSNGEAAGQTVFHFHLHLLPRYQGDGVTISHKAREAADAELAEICGKYRGL